MRLLKFKLLSIGILIGLFVFVFSFKAYAKEKNILMFLWQGETGSEKGFKDSLAEEFPEKEIKYKVLDAYRDKDRLKDLIEQTDETKYDLIYTYGSTVTSRVIKEFQKTPIIFDKVLDPITYKIVDSWDEKQPNLTGISILIPISIQIQKIHEVFGIADMGFIFNPLDKNSVEIKEKMEAILEKKGVELISFEFDKNFNSLKGYVDKVKDRVTCIYLPSEREVVGYIQRIFSTINRRKIPTCVTSTSTLKLGGTLCISVDYYEVGKSAGRLAAKILKGESPSDLPVLRPTESEIKLYVNSNIIKRFKINLPKDLKINYIK